jgi:hypothetical protein
VNVCHFAIYIRLDGIKMVLGWGKYKSTAKILWTWTTGSHDTNRGRRSQSGKAFVNAVRLPDLDALSGPPGLG